jgi:hypothetical protein
MNVVRTARTLPPSVSQQSSPARRPLRPSLRNLNSAKTHLVLKAKARLIDEYVSYQRSLPVSALTSQAGSVLKNQARLTLRDSTLTLHFQLRG